MSEELQKSLNEYLSSLASTVKDGATFAGEQIPLVIQEKLSFDLVWAIVWMVMGIILLVVCGWLITMGRKVYNLDRYNESIIGYAICSVASGLVGIGLMLNNLYIILNITLAPRLYIVEWVMGMVKK